MRQSRVPQSPPTPPEFEFVVFGTPVSAQARNPVLLAGWKARVSAAARQSWQAPSPRFDGDVALRITVFSRRKPGDLDNLSKPILDALQGIAYTNDRQVTRWEADWRSLTGAYVVLYMSLAVASGFNRGASFVWVRAGVDQPTEDLVR